MQLKIKLLIILITFTTMLTAQFELMANEAAQGVGNFQPRVNVIISTIKDVDFTLKLEGIVKTLYSDDNLTKVKAMVKLGDIKYIYNILDKEDYERLPLQLGNGSYTIDLYENTSGTKYKKVYTETGYVSIEDQNTVFLTSMQQINWSSEAIAIQMAAEIVKDYELAEGTAATEPEIISLLYDYVVQNISYDYKKIETLSYDYVPDIDQVLADGSGICYDYSVLLSSMLRSQGIPSKLIKGYCSFTDVYHAWNEIYLSEEERWVVVDTTYDAYMYRRRRKYTFEKSREDYTTSYEY